MDRREFVKTAAAGALTPLFVPRSAWGANDRIVYGTGNPGGGLNKVVQKLGGQRAALCDLYQPHLATPDHQHLPMHFRALDTRKNLYLGKPLSLTLDQSTRMISSRVRQSTQVVQIGMQRRSMGFIRQAKK